MIGRILSLLLALGLLSGFGLAQSPQLPEPPAVPAQLAPDEMRTTILEVRSSLCRDVDLAAQILTETGTLSQAIPVVMEMTGMQPAEIEAREAEVCRSDTATQTLEELRAGNRTAVWLVEVHLAAMAEVLPAP